MALAGVGRHVLSSLGGAGRSGMMMSKMSSGLQALVSSSEDEQQAQSPGPKQQQQQQQVPATGPLAYGLAASAALRPSGLRLTAAAGSSAMPLLPARCGLLGTGAARRTPALPHQVRNLNSWSTVQRYFVEGDYVVQAEVNRTFQFTGLDSGSFYPFVVYTIIATAIASVFMIVPWLVAPQRVDLDKASAYECGFDAFGEARQTFSVSFYLVSIMYLLFDIEICYLFPYVMCHANAQMFWTMNLFLSLLVVGFVYEWGVGALEWRS